MEGKLSFHFNIIRDTRWHQCASDFEISQALLRADADGEKHNVRSSVPSIFDLLWTSF
jgi:hypothetical protein